MARSDETIKKNVSDQLYWDTRVDASDVEVSVDSGVVTLTGQTPSYYAKQSAEDTALMVSGVISVVNKLDVKYPTSVTYPSDVDIQSNIESQLLWSTEIDSTKIEIEVQDNFVTLKGTVDEYWKKYRAETLADVTGVFGITNEIAVVPTETVVDEDIAEDVTAALERNVNVNVDDVTVKVKNGKVTLTGTVPSWIAFNSAENSAFYTLGVVEVENRLDIES